VLEKLAGASIYIALPVANNTSAPPGGFVVTGSPRVHHVVAMVFSILLAN
jgi:hypothetical protein